MDADPSTPSPALPVAANVSMKLPPFWPDAAKVWFAQADAQFTIKHVTVSKTKFYHAVAILPKKWPHSSSTSSGLLLLWTPTRYRRNFDNFVFSQQLSEVRGFGVPASHWRPETVTPDKPDVCLVSRQLQAGLHPQGTVFLPFTF